jgi:hypothetical protein
VWALAQGGDEEWLAGAATSLARLTHDDGAAVAGAVLAALLAHAVAKGGRLTSLEDRSGDREGRALRWGGAPPAARVRRAAEAALTHPGDPAAAGVAAEACGAEPGYAAALVGAARGAAPSEVDPALASLIERLA